MKKKNESYGTSICLRIVSSISSMRSQAELVRSLPYFLTSLCTDRMISCATTGLPQDNT